jgi:hypothetical protein
LRQALARTATRTGAARVTRGSIPNRIDGIRAPLKFNHKSLITILNWSRACFAS